MNKKFKGLSDFFINATEEEKREFYKNVIQKATEEQTKIIEQAKQMEAEKEID